MEDSEHGKRISEFSESTDFHEKDIVLLGNYADEDTAGWTTATFDADSLVKYYAGDAAQTYLSGLTDAPYDLPSDTYMLVRYPGYPDDSYRWAPFSDYVSQCQQIISATDTVDNILTMYDGGICSAYLSELHSGTTNLDASEFLLYYDSDGLYTAEVSDVLSDFLSDYIPEYMSSHHYWVDSHYYSMTNVYTSAPDYYYDPDTAEYYHLILFGGSPYSEDGTYSRIALTDLGSIVSTDVDTIYENCFYNSYPSYDNLVMFKGDDTSSNYKCTISEFFQALSSVIYDAISGFLNT